MTELETQLLKIIEEQQQQLQQQQAQIAAATAEFRRDAKENYPSLISTIKGNGERTERLSANTKVIIDNTDAISRIREKYGNVYRADQWQSQRDEPNYNELRGRTEKISTVQQSVSSEVAKAQQNLLETSELLKRISSR